MALHYTLASTVNILTLLLIAYGGNMLTVAVRSDPEYLSGGTNLFKLAREVIGSICTDKINAGDLRGQCVVFDIDCEFPRQVRLAHRSTFYSVSLTYRGAHQRLEERSVYKPPNLSSVYIAISCWETHHSE